MSEYFQNLPTIFYNIEKTKPSRFSRATNLTTRSKLRESIRKNIVAYYPYQIQDGDRPDIIAEKYYGSVNYTWLVLMANDIVDPYYGWPLFGVNFQRHVKDRYGSIATAQSTVHHYEQILRTEVAKTADTPRILERTVVVDATTYNDLASDSRRSITQYDFEVIENEKKRNIVLIEDIYAKQILDESRRLYS